MKKERTRFDAVADELFEKPPKPEPEPKLFADPARSTRSSRLTSPSANTYLSVMGRMIPLVAVNVITNNQRYDFEFAAPARIEVQLKIPADVKAEELMQEDVVLVIAHSGSEPDFLRLFITNVRRTVTSLGGYTEVEAHAVQIGV